MSPRDERPGHDRSGYAGPGRASLRALIVLPLLLLSGCLEVEQHPPYVNGAYAGQKDSQPFQRAFKNDPAAWTAAITARVQGQNEYRRTKP